MRRRVVLLAAMLAVAAPMPTTAMAARPVSAILVDSASGRVLYRQETDLVRPPASLTKMMTLYLTFEALDDGRLRLKDRVPISRHAAVQPPSRLGLQPGASLGVDEAIRAIAVTSANDVAVAMAEKLGGSEQRFARLMTAKALQLGMRRTVFANATGLPGTNMTTAEDIVTLSLALRRDHPGRYAYFATRSFAWRARQLPNHNHLLGRVDGLDGIKTGYTVDAGYNLAASAQRDGRRLIAVVMGERTVQARDRRVADMLEKGFAAVAAPARRGLDGLLEGAGIVPETAIVGAGTGPATSADGRSGRSD